MVAHYLLFQLLLIHCFRCSLSVVDNWTPREFPGSSLHLDSCNKTLVPFFHHDSTAVTPSFSNSFRPRRLSPVKNDPDTFPSCPDSPDFSFPVFHLLTAIMSDAEDSTINDSLNLSMDTGTAIISTADTASTPLSSSVQPPAFRATTTSSSSSSAPPPRGAKTDREISRSYVENLLFTHSSALNPDIASALQILLCDNLLLSSDADLLELTPSILRRYAGNNVTPIRVERAMKFLHIALAHPNFVPKVPVSKTPAVSALASSSNTSSTVAAAPTTRHRPKPNRNRTSFTLSRELMPKFTTETPNRDVRNTQLPHSRARFIPSASRTRLPDDNDPEDPGDDSDLDPSDEDLPTHSPFDQSNMSAAARITMMKIREKQSTNAVSKIHDFSGESVKWKSFARYFRQQMRLAGYEVVLDPDFLFLTTRLKWTDNERAEANAYVWTQLSGSCSKHMKASNQFILAGDDLEGHKCWIMLSSKHEILGRALSGTKRSELEDFAPLPDEDPIDLIDRLDFLLWEYAELPAPEAWPHHRKIRLLLRLLFNWDALHGTVDSIRRDIISGGTNALTYDHVVSTVSAYWVTFGKTATKVVRQLNIGVQDPPPPTLQDQFHALKLENEALKKATNDSSSRKPTLKKKQDKLDKPCASCTIEFSGFKGQNLCPTCWKEFLASKTPIKLDNGQTMSCVLSDDPSHVKRGGYKVQIKEFGVRRPILPLLPSLSTSSISPGCHFISDNEGNHDRSLCSCHA